MGGLFFDFGAIRTEAPRRCIPLKTLKLIVKRLKDLTVQEYIFEHMHDVGMSIPVFPEETLRC